MRTVSKVEYIVDGDVALLRVMNEKELSKVKEAWLSASIKYPEEWNGSPRDMIAAARERSKKINEELRAFIFSNFCRYDYSTKTYIFLN